jgi:hypothetical protein
MSMLVFWVVTLSGLVGRYDILEEHAASIFRAVFVRLNMWQSTGFHTGL